MSCSAPEHFVCPLTLDVILNPVKNAKTGHTYEHGAILEWMFRGNTTCPLTREPISPADLIPDKKLESEIQQWKNENGIQEEDEEEDEDDLEQVKEDESADEHALLNALQLRNRILELRNNRREAKLIKDTRLPPRTNSVGSLRNRVLQRREARYSAAAPSRGIQ